jgi:hypothetical protein
VDRYARSGDNSRPRLLAIWYSAFDTTEPAAIGANRATAAVSAGHYIEGTL